MKDLTGNIFSGVTMASCIFGMSNNEFYPTILIGLFIFVFFPLCIVMGFIGESLADKFKQWTGQKSTSLTLPKSP